MAVVFLAAKAASNPFGCTVHCSALMMVCRIPINCTSSNVGGSTLITIPV